LIKQKRLGVPIDSRQSFQLLREAEVISEASSKRMQSMVGFRNVAVHNCRALEPDIIKWVIDEGLDDLLTFANEIRNSAER